MTRGQRVIALVAAVLAASYVWVRGGFDAISASMLPANGVTVAGGQPETPEGLATATFAAGCFWCVEADFDKLTGVVSTTSGYTGGTVRNPSYEQVSRGGTGHTEAVRIVYDPSKVTYQQLLDHFWKNVDPLNAHRQFCDVGDQYRPAIFAHGEEQQRLAEVSRARVQDRFPDPVVVQVEMAGPFYVAEDYHQDYYKKNPVRYNYYRWSCGRDRRLKELWQSTAGTKR